MKVSKYIFWSSSVESLQTRVTLEVQGLFTGERSEKTQWTENQAVGIQRQTISSFLFLQRTLNKRKAVAAIPTSICFINNKGKTWNDSQNIKCNCYKILRKIWNCFLSNWYDFIKGKNSNSVIHVNSVLCSLWFFNSSIEIKFIYKSSMYKSVWFFSRFRVVQPQTIIGYFYHPKKKPHID